MSELILNTVQYGVSEVFQDSTLTGTDKAPAECCNFFLGDFIIFLPFMLLEGSFLACFLDLTVFGAYVGIGCTIYLQN